MNDAEMGKLIAEGYGCKVFKLPYAKPQYSNRRYAQKLGVSIKRVRQLGGRLKLRKLAPDFRKVLLRSMLSAQNRARTPMLAITLDSPAIGRRKYPHLGLETR